jgi:hypothetical protein
VFALCVMMVVRGQKSGGIGIWICSGNFPTNYAESALPESLRGQQLHASAHSATRVHSARSTMAKQFQFKLVLLGLCLPAFQLGS